MILRNTREPYDEVGPFDPESETGANWIEYYRQHGYQGAAQSVRADNPKPTQSAKGGETLTPAEEKEILAKLDNKKLASEISKGE